MAVTSTMLPLGTSAPDFSLRDVTTGSIVSLAELDDRPVVLVMFISNHCPYVKHVAAELARIGARLRAAQGVGIVAICRERRRGSTPTGRAPSAMRRVRGRPRLPLPLPPRREPGGRQGLPRRLHPGLLRLRRRSRSSCIAVSSMAARPANDEPVDGPRPAGRPRRRAGRKPGDREPQLASMGCNIKWKPGNEPDYFLS